jgi:GTPase SAR1 family protein
LEQRLQSKWISANRDAAAPKQVRSSSTLFDIFRAQELCPSSLCVLIGNKTDLDAHRLVSTAQGQAKARSLQMEYWEVSAKSGDKIQDLFNSVADLLLAQKRGRKGAFA